MLSIQAPHWVGSDGAGAALGSAPPTTHRTTPPMSNDPHLELRPVLARPPLRSYVSELWNRRSFIQNVPLNNLRAQNMDTVLGNLWFLVNPALQTGVYFLIFGVLLGTDRGIENYLAYLIIGVLTFNVVSQAVLAGSRCMASNLALVRSLYFPRAVIPLSTALTSIYTYLPGLVVILAVVIGSGERPALRWLVVPPVLALGGVFVVGATLAVARLGSRLPDLYSLLPHVLRLLFYLSGILFDPRAHTSNRWVRLAFDINPVYELVTTLRWALLGTEIRGWMWVALLSWTAAALIGGCVLFWRAETTYGSER